MMMEGVEAIIVWVVVMTTLLKDLGCWKEVGKEVEVEAEVGKEIEIAKGRGGARVVSLGRRCPYQMIESMDLGRTRDIEVAIRRHHQ